MAKIYHPDVNPSEEARRQMELINEAYRVLSRSAERRAYDEQQESKTKPQPAAAPQATEEMLKAQSPRDANRFEEKDAFMGLILCFLFMMNDPAAYLSHAGNLLLFWPFLAAVVLAAVLVRELAAAYFAIGLKGSRGSFGVLILSHAAAAAVFAMAASYIEFALDRRLFFYPILPALLGVYIPATVAAGIARAFTRTFNSVVGVLSGAGLGLLFGAIFATGTLLAQIAYLGPSAISEPDPFYLFKPSRAVLTAAAVAGMLGSVRSGQVFVFGVVDWFEEGVGRILKSHRGKSG